jgi:O-antigen/teichoic acid export membrane protein
MNSRLPKQGSRLNLKQWLAYLRSPFYRNSLFLITDYVVMGIIGFFFWILVARFYSPVDVGYGSAAISAMGLLSMLSLLGFNYTLIRFLPGEHKPAEMINTCLTLSGLISIVVAVVFVMGLSVWSPALLFIKQSIIFSAAFVVFALAYTFVAVIQNIYMASRRADLVLMLDIIQSILKIPLAVGLVLFFHSFGIAAASGIAIGLMVILGLFFIIPRIQKKYKPLPAFNISILSHLWHYSAGSYIASLLIAIPTWIIPIMVVNILGSEQNAYFYIVWTISSLFSAIAGSASQSLFVEGSHSSENLGLNVRKALRFTYLLLIPAVLVVLIFGSFFLSLFGTAYATNGLALLRLMAVSNLFGSVISIYSATLRINNQIRELYAIYAVQSISLISGIYFLLPVTGAIGIGYMWIGVQGIISLYVGWKLRKYVFTKP